MVSFFMSTNPSQTYKEIRHAINTGEIANLPKEKLAEFAAALSRSQAYTHFSAPEFQGLRESVNTFLLAKSNEEALAKIPNPAPGPPTEIPDKKNDWHEKPLGKIGIGIFVVVLAAVAIFLLKQFGVIF